DRGQVRRPGQARVPGRHDPAAERGGGALGEDPAAAGGGGGRHIPGVAAAPDRPDERGTGGQGGHRGGRLHGPRVGVLLGRDQAPDSGGLAVRGGHQARGTGVRPGRGRSLRPGGGEGGGGGVPADG